VKKRKRPVVLENVLVEDYAAEGKSLGRVDGKVVFIENVVPGDMVDVQLFKNKKDWAEGFPLRFNEYSKDRVNPFCDHFGVCGGCQWQMLPYEKQLTYQQKQVEAALRRIAKVQIPEILPIIGAEQTRQYRNKMEYTFCTKKYLTNEEVRSGVTNVKDVAGFHAKGVFDKVVEIHVCHLQDEPTNQMRNAVRDFAVEQGMPFYDIKTHLGWLRNMQVRLATTGELMVNIVLGYEDEQNRKLLLDYVMQQFPQITTLL
jgi:23S rRNA (uracil1939-C5)-methyltransferase